MRVLIIIPAYNEEESIENVIASIEAINSPDQIDYIVINDCSTDSTKNVLSEKEYQYLDLPVNLGIGGGVQTGYLFAREKHYDIAIQVDGDGQHDVSYINKLNEPLARGEADVVIGSRFIDKEGFQSSFMRRVGITFLSNLIHVLTSEEDKIYDVTSGFRAVNKKGIELYAREYAQDYPEPEAILTGRLHGLRIREVPVIMKERSGGSSSINGLKTLYYMIKVSVSLLLNRFIIKRSS